jgi:hypothetical protein
MKGGGLRRSPFSAYWPPTEALQGALDRCQWELLPLPDSFPRILRHPTRIF